MILSFLLLVNVTLQGEPPARKLGTVPVRVTSPFTNVSAVGELPNGLLIVTDANAPAVFVLDATGTRTQVGSVGGGPGQYARPGGLYAGAADSMYMIDRGQTRAFVVSPNGVLGSSRSIAVRGETSSSTDADMQRLDARGLVYFIRRARSRVGDSGVADSNVVMRLNATTQKQDTIARLRKAEEKTVQAGDNMTMSQSVIGSPADGWAVAADGRVAVVRAAPYRIEWYSPAGRVMRGATVKYDALPMTDADKKAYAASHKDHAGVGATGQGAVDSNGLGLEFAPTKSPIVPMSVMIATDGRVWVERTAVLGDVQTTYDVFDATGERADRVAIPAIEHIVGFGANAVYTVKKDGSHVVLNKYKVKS